MFLKYNVVKMMVLLSGFFLVYSVRPAVMHAIFSFNISVKQLLHSFYLLFDSVCIIIDSFAELLIRNIEMYASAKLGKFISPGSGIYSKALLKKIFLHTMSIHQKQLHVCLVNST